VFNIAGTNHSEYTFNIYYKLVELYGSDLDIINITHEVAGVSSDIILC